MIIQKRKVPFISSNVKKHQQTKHVFHKILKIKKNKQQNIMNEENCQVRKKGNKKIVVEQKDTLRIFLPM